MVPSTFLPAIIVIVDDLPDVTACESLAATMLVGLWFLLIPFSSMLKNRFRLISEIRLGKYSIYLINIVVNIGFCGCMSTGCI